MIARSIELLEVERELTAWSLALVQVSGNPAACNRFTVVGE
jgi:hypothetical protein